MSATTYFFGKKPMENPILFLLRKSGVHFPKALLGNYARPDFAELDVFLGQHILLTLGQHFYPKM